MSLISFDAVIPAASAAATLCVTLRYGADVVLCLVAGFTAILGKDEKSRASRALDVLRTIRRDDRPPAD
jgi:hypothetical protein